MNDYIDQENQEVESSDNQEVESSGNQEVESSDNQEVESSDNQEVESSEYQSIDYTDLLESIDSRLATLESIDYSEDIKNCSDNAFRLYYFIGGLYVVFFIIIAIKFFKQFF